MDRRSAYSQFRTIRPQLLNRINNKLHNNRWAHLLCLTTARFLSRIITNLLLSNSKSTLRLPSQCREFLSSCLNGDMAAMMCALSALGISGPHAFLCKRNLMELSSWSRSCHLDFINSSTSLMVSGASQRIRRK